MASLNSGRGFGELVQTRPQLRTAGFSRRRWEKSSISRVLFRTPISYWTSWAGPFIGGRYGGNALESFAYWRSAIAEVANCPNVVLKIGGLNMHYAGVDAGGLPQPRSSQETAEKQRDYVPDRDRCLWPRSMHVRFQFFQSI